MKIFKRSLAILLAVGLFAGLLAAPSLAWVPADEVTWEVDARPVILIHGIMQSRVFLRDAAGEPVLGDNGRPVELFPPAVDETALILQLVPALLGSLALQCDVGLTRSIRAALNEFAEPLRNDRYGRLVENFEVERFPTSVADMTDEERGFVYSMLPVQNVSGIIGEENVYFFTYNSFGNHRDIVSELYQFIQAVRERHGVDRVNLVPISLGGTLFNGLIEYYPSVRGQLNNVVITIGAMDGSNLAGDLFTKNLAIGNRDLYRDLFPLLLEDDVTGMLVNLALRLFPRRMIHQIFDAVLEALIGDVLSYHTMMWALVPSGHYETARELWLSGSSHDAIREQTDAYHRAQLNSRATIQRMQAYYGVRLYVIAEHDFPMVPLGATFRDYNADGLIQLDSASLGATSAPLGSQLSEAHRAAVDPRYISPCGVIDVSTATLPDHTFFFREQDHEGTGRSDIIIRLITRLVSDAEYQDVFSMPEWPQFNYGRETRNLVGDMNWSRNYIDWDALAPEQLAQLEEAIALVEAMLANTIVDPAQTAAAEQALRSALITLGYRSAPAPERLLDRAMPPLARFINGAVYCLYGPRGFSDPVWLRWR